MMTSTFRAPALFATLLFLAGCATSFQKPPQDQNYGSPPSAPLEAAKAYFSDILKDPDSARYKLLSCARAYSNKGLAYGGDVAWAGYACFVTINAKNSFGGYTGAKPYTVLFTNDLAVSHMDGHKHVLLHVVD